MHGKYLLRNEEAGAVPVGAAEEEEEVVAAAVPAEALRQALHHHLDHLAPLQVREGLQEAVAQGARSKLPHIGAMSTSSDVCSSTGSAAKPSYGGGKYYGGGSPTAYRAGGRSPRGLAPVAIGLGAAAIIFPGIWLYGAYNYPYTNRYSYRNSTRRANNTNDSDQRRLLKRQDDQNVSLPVTCLCAMYSACGCDDNEDPSYLDSVIGDGTNLNESLVHIGPVNGTDTIALNGTLPNTTDSESDTSSSSSTAASSAGTTQRILETSGIWVLGGIVGATVWLL